METENLIKININATGVLKFVPNTNQIEIGFEPISRPLDNDFEQFCRLFEDHTKDAESILDALWNHSTLCALRAKYGNYCQNFAAAYEGLPAIPLTIDQIKARGSNNVIYQQDEFKKKKKEELLEDLKVRLQAQYLNRAYEICDQKILLREILAYSHRRVGWSTPKYKLNDDFSIEIKTNFGFGYVSYFYTRLQYKGLDIIPFADWIIYEQARLYEIINYSAKHNLTNESWLEALEYSKEACNLSLIDETAFVRKYIVDECERMVSGLESFLKAQKFMFINLERIYTDVHKEGHNLIEFRGEKISGALGFIKNIIQFDKIAEMKGFVNRIEACNKTLQPILLNEIKIINQEILKLNIIFDEVKPIYKVLKKRNIAYESIKSTVSKKWKVNQRASVYDSEEIEMKFKEENPEYENFYAEYKKIKECYLPLSPQITSLELIKNNILGYNTAIQTYFDGISPLNNSKTTE